MDCLLAYLLKVFPEMRCAHLDINVYLCKLVKFIIIQTDSDWLHYTANGTMGRKKI